MLKLQNIHKSFEGIRAAKGVSFEVEKGQTAALIGPNGAGKSTVLNLISGFIQPDQGKILLNNKDITSWSAEKIASFGVSRLFQEPSLFDSLSVWDNLTLAVDTETDRFWKNIFKPNRLDQEKRRKVLEILKEMEIEKLKDRIVGDLSFGQKRLVGLAMALVKPHRLLLLDEPIAGISPALKQKITQLVLKLKNQGETILFVEHNMDFKEAVADKVIELKEGQC